MITGSFVFCLFVCFLFYFLARNGWEKASFFYFTDNFWFCPQSPTNQNLDLTLKSMKKIKKEKTNKIYSINIFFSIFHTRKRSLKKETNENGDIFLTEEWEKRTKKTAWLNRFFSFLPYSNQLAIFMRKHEFLHFIYSLSYSAQFIFYIISLLSETKWLRLPVCFCLWVCKLTLFDQLFMKFVVIVHIRRNLDFIIKSLYLNSLKISSLLRP